MAQMSRFQVKAMFLQVAVHRGDANLFHPHAAAVSPQRGLSVRLVGDQNPGRLFAFGRAPLRSQ